jgi:hypothetical protein
VNERKMVYLGMETSVLGELSEEKEAQGHSDKK